MECTEKLDTPTRAQVNHLRARLAETAVTKITLDVEKGSTERDFSPGSAATFSHRTGLAFDALGDLFAARHARRAVHR